jgi:hypothetical protein
MQLKYFIDKYISIERTHILIRVMKEFPLTSLSFQQDLLMLYLSSKGKVVLLFKRSSVLISFKRKNNVNSVEQ